MPEEYIAVDLETTGLSPAKDGIIEIGAVHFIKGEPAGEFQTLLRPGCMIPERITELTGISEKMLCQAPVFEEIAEEFLEFSGELPIVGHNILFDYSFLKRAFGRLGTAYERRGIDTLKLCRQFLPPEAKKNLGAACSLLGIQCTSYHRALNDAMCTGLLLEQLRREYFSGGVEAFEPKQLNYTIKREQPAQIRQKQYLIDFAKWHKIDVPVDIDSLTRSEASRLLDQWIARYGRVPGRK